jgi:hypothetical protein
MWQSVTAMTSVWLLAAAMACLADDRASGPGEASMQAAVRSDWELQEKRFGRTADAPAASQTAFDRVRRLLAELRGMSGVGDLSAETATLERLAPRVAAVASLDAPARRHLYFEIRSVGREIALKNPLVFGRPIAFMLRRRAVGYMLYEYLGWYYAHGNDPTSGYKNPQCPTPEPGGGVFLLNQPGRSMEATDLTAGRPARGHYVTLSSSYDAKTLYFAFADPSGKDPYTLPDYALAPAAPGERYNSFHLFAVDADGGRLRQLTDGPHDDFDPCPLPDGGLAFESTRCGSKLRCGGGSPELVNTLHRMDADGKNLRTVSFHETHEWHPSVLGDGRLLYTRWDYVDRNAAKFHGLWTSNPDGANPSILFGNHTTLPWACYQAKAIPGSHRILLVAGGHHANVGGTLLMLDPSRSLLDPASGEDRPEAWECLTPEVTFAEARGWPKSYFYSPWPLSENFFLVAFSHDPLCGGYTGQTRETHTGLYYLDRFGNLELLYRREGISAVYPIPLAPRAVPPVRTSPLDAALGEEGEFFVSDVRKSLMPLPADRPVRQLRVFQLLPKTRSDRADDPRIGHAEQSNARLLLGTVPVEEDGSAFFRAPARKLLYFQAVDASGRAVQGMRSVVYLQPGERRSCVGCHEPRNTAPSPIATHASRRSPSTIVPGPDGSSPFGYPRLVQPVLARHCVGCHDGTSGEGKAAPALTGEPAGAFTRSYESLKPYLRWPSYDTATRPGQLGADISPLAAILTSEKHRKHVVVPEADLRTLYLWLDAQSPFYGAYGIEDLQAQLHGRAIAPPSLP